MQSQTSIQRQTRRPGKPGRMHRCILTHLHQPAVFRIEDCKQRLQLQSTRVQVQGEIALPVVHWVNVSLDSECWMQSRSSSVRPDTDSSARVEFS